MPARAPIGACSDYSVTLLERIQRLHPVDLVRRDPRQVADETHELPHLLVPGRIRLAGAKRRHAGEADAVLDDVEDLAVGQTSGLRRRACRAAWGITLDRSPSLATAVVAVAHRTIAGKVLQPEFELLRGRRIGFDRALTSRGIAKPADRPRHARLQRRAPAVHAVLCASRRRGQPARRRQRREARRPPPERLPARASPHA